MQKSKSVSSLKRESTTTSTCSNQIDTNVNLEYVTFVWLDLRQNSTSNFVNALRAINHNVRIYADATNCLDYMKSSDSKIFFISSLGSGDFLSEVHPYKAIEVIFVLDPDANAVRGDFAKLIDVCAQQEELLRTLKIAFQIFVQLRLEEFTFQTDRIFPWWQLWKEEVSVALLRGRIKVHNELSLYFHR